MTSHSSSCKCPDCIATNNQYNYEGRIFKTTSQDSYQLGNKAIGNLNANKLFNTQSIVTRHTTPIDTVLTRSGFVFETIESLVGNKYENTKYFKALPVVSTVVRTGAGDGTLYTIVDERLTRLSVFNALKTIKGKVVDYDVNKDEGNLYTPKLDLEKLIATNSRNLIEVDADGLLTVKLDPDGYLEKGPNGLKLNQSILNTIFK